MDYALEYIREFNCHPYLLVLRAIYNGQDIYTFAYGECMALRANKMLGAGIITPERWVSYHREVAGLISIKPDSKENLH